jgi:hypothetical protein
MVLLKVMVLPSRCREAVGLDIDSLLRNDYLSVNVAFASVSFIFFIISSALLPSL